MLKKRFVCDMSGDFIVGMKMHRLITFMLKKDKAFDNFLSPHLLSKLGSFSVL